MTATCPTCKGFAEERRGRMTAFRMADGVTHVAPDMWLAGRSGSLERDGHTPMASYGLACVQWAEHCAIEAQFNRERKAS